MELFRCSGISIFQIQISDYQYFKSIQHFKLLIVNVKKIKLMELN
jgi:hypothetical protein